MSKIPTITKELLAPHDPCKDQLRRFIKLYPDGLHLTEANWSLFIKEGFDWDWLACLLSGSALAKYDKVCQLARDKLNRVCQLAWADYYKVCQLARAEYDKTCQLARADYYKVCQSVLLDALKKSINPGIAGE